MYEAGYYAVDVAMYGFLGICVFVFFILIGLAMLLEKRKSKKYREVIGDLYVAAKIKEIATKEGLDLEKENTAFLEWCRKKKFESRSFNYDDVVEEELNMKVKDKLTEK